MPLAANEEEVEKPQLDITTRRYLNEFLEEVESLVVPGLVSRLVRGAVAVEPAELARRMLSITPAPAPRNKMAEQVGPEFYDTNGAAVMVAGPGNEPVTKQAMEQRRRRHAIVALPTRDGRWIYPTWQFDGGTLLPGLKDVLAAFYSASERASAGRGDPAARSFDEWSVGTWLTTPHSDLGGKTPVDWLKETMDREGDDGPKRLVALARQTALRWAA